MAGEGTFFKVYRQIFESDIWLRPVELRLFIYLIGNARHSKQPNTKYKNKGIVIKRGQYLRSYRKLQKDLEYLENNGVRKHSLSRLKTAIDRLEKQDRIKTEKTEFGTLFTVVNYCNYQGSQNKSNQPRTHSEQGENRVRTHSEQGENNTKNVKNVKNDKNTSSSTSAGTCESDNNKGVSSDIKIRNWLHTYWGRKEVTEKRVQALVKFTDKVDLDLIKDAIIRSQNARDPFTYCCGSYDDDYVLKGGMLNKCINQGVTCIEGLQNNSGGDDGGERSRGNQEEVCEDDSKKQAKHRARRI